MAKRTREQRMEDLLAAENTDPAYNADPEERELTIEGTEIFFRNQSARTQLIINRGGAGSGKSHALAQLILHKFFTEDRKKILIIRKTLPSLRISTYGLLNDLASSYGLRDRITEEKVHMNWYYNGSMIHFGGLDNPEKIKCFHPDTEILTDKGWVVVNEVKDF